MMTEHQIKEHTYHLIVDAINIFLLDEDIIASTLMTASEIDATPEEVLRIEQAIIAIRDDFRLLALEESERDADDQR